LDLVELKPVAVKVFKEAETEGQRQEVQKLFKQSVAVMQTLGCQSAQQHRSRRRDSFTSQLIEEEAVLHWTQDNDFAEAFDSMDLHACFIKLLEYSKDSHGNPGVDSDCDTSYLVTELGEESLADFYQRRAESAEPLSADELRVLQWGLVSIVCGLHAAGYVHLDIKPRNVMRIRETWKLIDFDGAVKTDTSHRVSMLAFTPIYMAPEVAASMVAAREAGGQHRSRKANDIRVSRLMDVWSLGMCALEAVFLQPILEPWYNEWLEETGDESKFYSWLCDYSTEGIVAGDMLQAMEDIHPDMADLLKLMLVKDPANRHSAADCIVHRWFDPIRTRMWQEFSGVAQTPMSSDCGQLSCRSSVGMRLPPCSPESKPFRLTVKHASRACVLM